MRDFMERVGDFLLDYFGWLVALFVVVVIGAMIAWLVWISRQPNIELLKSEWTCTDSRTSLVTTWVMSGKVMVPMVVPYDECVQWSKHP